MHIEACRGCWDMCFALGVHRGGCLVLKGNLSPLAFLQVHIFFQKSIDISETFLHIIMFYSTICPELIHMSVPSYYWSLIPMPSHNCDWIKVENVIEHSAETELCNSVHKGVFWFGLLVTPARLLEVIICSKTLLWLFF